MAPLKTLLLVALLLGALLQDTHAARAGNVGRECCLQFYKGSIPGKLLVDWYQTPGDCPNKAIVLVTRHGKNICANPNDKNVKRAMKYFQKHRKSPDLAV
ncbi:C-C motif chemokine 17 [Muntiacus reevesi]|uniref:C-C motif chemokine 17 n=1 Tax=Muntiacus reevesi TaxID=9886 RepID=UPI003306FA44